MVIRPLWSTTLVKRLADGFVTLYSNSDLKRYDNKSPLFNNLPPEVNKVLLHNFQDLLQSDMAVLTQHDNLNIPQGIQLFQQEEIADSDNEVVAPIGPDRTKNNATNEQWQNYPLIEPKDEVLTGTEARGTEEVPDPQQSADPETVLPKNDLQNIDAQNTLDPDQQQLNIMKDLKELDENATEIENPDPHESSESETEEEPQKRYNLRDRTRHVRFI